MMWAKHCIFPLFFWFTGAADILGKLTIFFNDLLQKLIFLFLALLSIFSFTVVSCYFLVKIIPHIIIFNISLSWNDLSSYNKRKRLLCEINCEWQYDAKWDVPEGELFEWPKPVEWLWTSVLQYHSDLYRRLICCFSWKQLSPSEEL